MRAALNGYRIPMMELLVSYAGVLEVVRRPLDRLVQQLDADPMLVHRRFPELDCGSTGGRRLLLQGATLLHVAAEFGVVVAARLLLDRGADVNARATVDDAGIGGQTAIFHAVTQFADQGLPMAQLLVEHGADLSVRVRLPGLHERPEEVVECTPHRDTHSCLCTSLLRAQAVLWRSCENEAPSSESVTRRAVRHRS